MHSQKNQSGLTLIELILVIAIISVIAVLSIPNLLRSRMSAQHASVAGSLRTINAAQTDYFNNRTDNKTYAATLKDLNTAEGAGNIAFLDPNLATGLKAGYTFEMIPGAEGLAADAASSFYTWSATAWPLSYLETGVFSFYVDDTGVIRAINAGGGKATADAPENW